MHQVDHTTADPSRNTFIEQLYFPNQISMNAQRIHVMIMPHVAIRLDPTHVLVMMDILVMGGHAATLMSATTALAMPMLHALIHWALMNVIVMTHILEMAGTVEVCFDLSDSY